MIADIIHKVAGFERKDAQYRPRPSAAGQEICAKKLVYHAQGVVGEQPADRMAMVLDDSSWHEELTADWICKSGYALHSRQMPITLTNALPFMAGHPAYHCWECSKREERPVRLAAMDLHGHIDGILTDILDTDYLWEHKALNHFTFERYWGGEDPVDYFVQSGVIYVRGVQVWQPRCRKCCLLIKNKNTAAYLEYLLDYDRDTDTLVVEEVINSNGDRRSPGTVYAGLYRQAIEKFETIERHRASGTLPQRPFPPDDWHCRYCPYQRTCWEGAGGNNLDQAEIALDSETAEAAKEYIALGQSANVNRKRQDELKKMLRLVLYANNAVQGRGDGVLVRIETGVQRRIDADMLPPDVREQITKETQTEKLVVKLVASAPATQKEERCNSHASRA
jgi:CRISPR/Cas system-associated exonuclease Cas4 (RecB family)